MRYIKYFETTQERQSCTDTYKYMSFTDEDKVVNIHPYDYSKDYLTFIAKSAGTFAFNPISPNKIYYSIDNGETWLSSNTTTSINVNTGDKVLWKGNMTSPGSVGSPDRYGIGTFSQSTASFDIQGNILSLYYGDYFIGNKSAKAYEFSNLFTNTKCINAKDLVLVSSVQTYCLSSLFSNCTSLITAPKLPATTLARSCYSSMFFRCTSLKSAPELPATTLDTYCYSSMFSNCTSLTTAPELPATTLADYCYRSIFNGCTNLNNITMLATDISASNCLNSWVNSVAASGTFVKAASMTTLPSGVNGIPEGWTIIDI